MKFLTVIALLAMSVVSAAEPAPEEQLSEEQYIALLINAANSSLEQLKQVQSNLKDFRAQEAICIKMDDAADALYQLSVRALKLLDSIRAAHVEPYFRPAFVDELEKISRVAKGKALAPVLAK